MTYDETVQWMFGRLPMYQQLGKKAYTNKLDNIVAFVRYLGYPERRFGSVHIAGTNGKGSVSHMMASVLQEAGYRTGLYTSPHLKDFRERIRINGGSVSEDFVIRFIEMHRAFLERNSLSFFEMSVGMAFAYFAEEKVDIAVVETGLGGRLDSTNILNPEVSVITNVSYDHTDILGHTLREIAHEKAGIIKPGVPVVVSEYQEESFPVFSGTAEQQGSPLALASESVMEKYATDLRGAYQDYNIKGAVAALKQLKGFPVREADIKKGLLRVVENTGLQGRWQVLGTTPKVLCDTAHNAAGLELVFKQLKKEVFKRLHVVFGMVKDKDTTTILGILPEEASYYFCRPAVPRGLDAEELQRKAEAFQLKGDVYSSVSEAYRSAKEKAAPDDLIYIGGSTFVVGEVL